MTSMREGEIDETAIRIRYSTDPNTFRRTPCFEVSYGPASLFPTSRHHDSTTADARMKFAQQWLDDYVAARCKEEEQ